MLTGEQSQTEDRTTGAAKRATIILNERCDIVMCGGQSEEFVVCLGGAAKSLRPDLRAIVAEHTRKRGDEVKTSFLEPNWIVRTQPVRGSREWFSVLSIEPVHNSDTLTRAAQRFSLTRRELDVLALMLDGLTASEIGETLQIAIGTVQVYYKRLLSKTSARNRTAMVAHVFAWRDQSAGAARREFLQKVNQHA